MATPKKKSVPAKRGKNAVANVADYGDYTGQGFENQDQSDLAIPFISVLQPLSKALDEIPEAKAGMIFNTVTKEVYPDGVLFVPGSTQHCFVEWTPREAGGGMVAVHQVSSEMVQDAKKEHEFGKLKTPEGNDLVETFYMFGALAGSEADDVLGMAMIAFVSTKIKVYKGINTRLSTFQVPRPGGRGRVTPPMFAHLLKITASEKLRAPGGEYFNFVISSAGANLVESLLAPTDKRFLAGQEVCTLVAEGKLRGNYADEGEEAEDDNPI